MCLLLPLGALACASGSADGNHAAVTDDAVPDAGAAETAAPNPADADSASGTPGEDAAEDLGPPGLPHVHAVDPAAAARGSRLFFEGWPGVGVIPELALRHLYLAWTQDLLAIYGYFSDEASYWTAFRDRYGMVRSPEPGATLPLGLLPVGGGQASVTCLLCHASEAPGGEVHIGLPNSRLDLQGFYDDLMALPAAFESLRQKPLPEPYKSLVAGIPVPPVPDPLPGMTGRTGAPGATDAMGLGILFGTLALGKDPEVDGIATRFGFQNPNAWWTVPLKKVRYWDGSVPFGAHRTMMATLLGLGLTFDELIQADSAFHDVEQYFLTLEPPPWPFAAPQPESVAAGRAVFRAHCSECHGIYEGPDRAYPGRVVPAAEVGTDPARATNFGAKEAAVANALITDPNHVMTPTGGYLAPPLAGIWSTAPYFHNGSVPDIAAVLNSPERPARWRRTGDYDPARMGWAVTPVDGPAGPDAPPKTIEARRTVETSHPGLSRAGHTYGDPLTAEERAAVLDYLKTL